MRDIGADDAANERVEQVLQVAAEFFEDFLWNSDSCRAARASLARKGVDEPALREFQVGYAPIGPKELLEHLAERGYGADEIQAAGLATSSARGHLHTHFRSRVMFPIRERRGCILGFAGLATHLGPSWPLWQASPDCGLYRRSEAIFGLDQAAEAIARSGKALLLNDCLEVLKAHQRGEREAVAVHSGRISQEQLRQLAAALPDGTNKVELVFGEGMGQDTKPRQTPLRAVPQPRPAGEATQVETVGPEPESSRRPRKMSSNRKESS